MSSWRNAVKDKVHKERSQPIARQKLGILEKHKDYKQRANRMHLKDNMIRNLKLKAALRNPDEFNTKMITLSRKGTDGKAANESKKVAKKYDKKFLNAKLVEKQRKEERIVSSLQLIDNEEKNQHTIFVDDEKEMKDWDSAAYFNTLPELVDRKYNRLSEEQLREVAFSGDMLKDGELEKLRNKREERYKALAQNMEDEETIHRVMGHIELQKHLAEKGRRKKIKEGEDGHAPVYKWFFERKK